MSKKQAAAPAVKAVVARSLFVRVTKGGKFVSVREVRVWNSGGDLLKEMQEAYEKEGMKVETISTAEYEKQRFPSKQPKKGRK